MRTTLDIDPDVLSAARAIAAAERTSVGRVISALARRSLRPALPAEHGGVPAFPVPPDAAVFGPTEVAAALDEP